MNVVVRWLVKATTTTGDGGGSARDWLLSFVSFFFFLTFTPPFFLSSFLEVAIEAVLILSPSAVLAFADGAEKKERERDAWIGRSSKRNSLTDNIFNNVREASGWSIGPSFLASTSTQLSSDTTRRKRKKNVPITRLDGKSLKDCICCKRPTNSSTTLHMH